MSNQHGPVTVKKSFGKIIKKLVNGGTPPTEVKEFWNGKIPWITGADFTSNGIGEFRRFVSAEAISHTATNLIEQGQLLLVTRTGVGKLAIAPCDIAISQDITGVYPDPEQVDIRFLLHRMRLGVEDLKKLNQGTSINGIIRSDLVAYPIDLPQLSQQRRIAEILTTLDETIEQTEALIAKYQQIKAGLMHDLFTRGVTPDGRLRPTRDQAPHLYKLSALGWIPKEWDTNPIELLLSKIIDYRGKTPIKAIAGVPLITAKNVRMGFIDPEPREFIAERDYPMWMTRGIPKESDILFTTEAPLGNVAQIGTTEKVAFAQRIIILQPAPFVLPMFLRSLLMSRSFQSSVFRLSTGTTALGVKQSEFRKIVVAYPSDPEEQKAAVESLSAIEEYEATEIKKVEKLKEQKQGLMHDLLTGHVRVRTPEATAA